MARNRRIGPKSEEFFASLVSTFTEFRDVTGQTRLAGI
jgi:hypothetical protein